MVSTVCACMLISLKKVSLTGISVTLSSVLPCGTRLIILHLSHSKISMNSIVEVQIQIAEIQISDFLLNLL